MNFLVYVDCLNSIYSENLVCHLSNPQEKSTTLLSDFRERERGILLLHYFYLLCFRFQRWPPTWWLRWAPSSHGAWRMGWTSILTFLFIHCHYLLDKLLLDCPQSWIWLDNKIVSSSVDRDITSACLPWVGRTVLCKCFVINILYENQVLVVFTDLLLWTMHDGHILPPMTMNTNIISCVHVNRPHHRWNKQDFPANIFE